jgi:hypothetical protein
LRRIGPPMHDGCRLGDLGEKRHLLWLVDRGGGSARPLYGELLGVGQGRGIQLRAPCRGQSPTSPRPIGGGARCARHRGHNRNVARPADKIADGLTGSRVGSALNSFRGRTARARGRSTNPAVRTTAGAMSPARDGPGPPEPQHQLSDGPLDVVVQRGPRRGDEVGSAEPPSPFVRAEQLPVTRPGRGRTCARLRPPRTPRTSTTKSAPSRAAGRPGAPARGDDLHGHHATPVRTTRLLSWKGLTGAGRLDLRR